MGHRLLKRGDRDRGKGILWAVTTAYLFLFIAFIIAVPEVVFAQEGYPTKPINLIVGYHPGGTTDVCARPLAAAASKILGQPIVVVNKPGGASVVGMTSLKNEKPDGYTIGILVTSAIGSQYMRNVPYNSAIDFTPIVHVAVNVYGLVVQADSPWKTFREFIDYSKTNPGKIRYSTAGVGSPQHLVMERLALIEKIKWTHVPFEGGAPAVTALLGGHVEACSQTSEWKKHVESGRLRLLVVYGEKRMVDFPNVPTLLELGFNITAPTILCILGPKGLSSQVVETLHEAFKKAMEDPDFIRVMAQMDMVIVYKNRQALAKRLVELNEEIGSLIRNLGLRKE